nr:hypothetical protein [Tanacetum cinerariifolium]
MATSSSSIASKLKSPTSSTSPSTNGYLNSPLFPPPRVPPLPPTQDSRPMYITFTLSPITPLDIQFNTPSPPLSFFGYPIPWNLLEAHGDSCLYIIVTIISLGDLIPFNNHVTTKRINVIQLEDVEYQQKDEYDENDSKIVLFSTTPTVLTPDNFSKGATKKFVGSIFDSDDVCLLHLSIYEAFIPMCCISMRKCLGRNVGVRVLLNA